MKYLFDIDGKHYDIELSEGEAKRLEYANGRFANVTVLMVREQPTPTKTGWGFLRVEFENGRVWDTIATIARVITEQERERSRIGQRIAQLRKEQGMTQVKLAEAADILQPNLARIENGRYGMTVDAPQYDPPV